MPDHTEQIGTQVRHGGEALAKTPLSSLAKKEAPIQRLEVRSVTFVVISHMCRFSKRHLYKRRVHIYTVNDKTEKLRQGSKLLDRLKEDAFDKTERLENK